MCPVGIEGQYKFDVIIGNKENFLKEDKFISFTLIENIGLSLPYWEFQYDNVFPELLEFLNEKQSIEVQLGTSVKDLEPISLIIKKPIINPRSSESQSVTLRGFSSMLDYLESENISTTDQISSMELAQSIAKKHSLKFESNMSSTNDKMMYMQPRTTDFKFLFTEWLHSNSGIKDDIIIPTITSDGRLTYNSLNKLIASVDPKSIQAFTDSKPEKDEIQVNANTGAESNTTLTNMLGGYVKQRDIFYVSTGTLEHIDISNNVPMISESKTNSIDENISKSSGVFVQGDNVHPTYYRQELLNIQKWLSIQSSRQWISVPDRLVKNIYPGQLVMYMTKKENGQINDAMSGLFLVTKRVISIKNRKVSTNFLLSRENLNYSK